MKLTVVLGVILVLATVGHCASNDARCRPVCKDDGLPVCGYDRTGNGYRTFGSDCQLEHFNCYQSYVHFDLVFYNTCEYYLKKPAVDETESTSTSASDFFSFRKYKI